MHPFSWIAAYVIAKLFSRRCPRCGGVNMVPKSKRHEAVACTRCGESIPPRRQGS